MSKDQTKLEQVRAQRAAAPYPVCEWYLLCDSPATMLVKHPVLAPVPTCDRCAAKHDLSGDPL